jgi:phosphomannomutase
MGQPQMKKLIVFDLDGTLAESKASLDTEMSALLHDLLGIVKVAVISGDDWLQFEKQVLSNLPHDERLKNLSILPTCGTKFYQYTGDWKKIYSEDFTADEKEKIVSSLKKAVGVAGFKVEKIWGETIENRGSQITFSALGQQAPLEEKEKSKQSLTLLFPNFLSEWVALHPLMSLNLALTKPTESESYETSLAFH